MLLDDARVQRQAGNLLGAKAILERLSSAERSLQVMFERFLNCHALMEFSEAAMELDGISVRLADEPCGLEDRQFEQLLRLGEALAPANTMLRLMQAVDRLPTISQVRESSARAIRHRHSFAQTKLATLNVRTMLVPLGINCLPHNLMGRWGLKEFNPFREDIGPFSLAQHTLQSVYDAVVSDFSDYIDAGKMVAMKTPNGHVPARLDGSITWNHNPYSYWIRNDFHNLIKALIRQIQNFREIRKADQPLTLVVCLNGGPNNSRLNGSIDIYKNLSALNELLRRYSGKSQCRIIALDCRHYVSTELRILLTPRVRYRYFALPSPSYIWHTDMNQPNGLEFEEALIDFVIDGLHEWQLC